MNPRPCSHVACEGTGRGSHLHIVGSRPGQVRQEGDEHQLQEAAVVPVRLAALGLGAKVEARAAVRVPAQGPHHARRHPVQQQRRHLQLIRFKVKGIRSRFWEFMI